LLLALGIGAATAVFSLAYRVIRESLPVAHPEELVELGYDDKARGFLTGFSNPGFQLFAKDNQVFSELVAFSDTFKLDVSRKGIAEFADVVFQSTNMDSMLGLRPVLGRLINDADGQSSGGAAAAVLSYRYWQNRFGGDPSVIGETITINNTAVVIVGVAPRGFQGMILGAAPDVILPLPIVETIRRVPVLNNGANLGLHIVARQKPGLTLEQIRESMQPLYRTFVDHAVSSFPPQFATGIKGAAANWQFRVRPAPNGANSDVQQNLRQSLTILLLITVLVFVIACTNLAALFITRNEARMRELSTRLAIGCSGGRLVRQIVTESMVLAVLAGGGGLAMSLWSRGVLLTLLTSRASAIEIPADFTTPLLAFALSVLAGLLLGLAPAVTAYRASQKPLSAQISRYSRSRGRRALVVVQIAVSFVLVAVAGQFAFSLQNYRNILPGFQADHLVLFDVSVRGRTITFARQARESISQLPGVLAVSHSSSPVGQLNWITPIRIPGVESTTPGGNMTGRNIVGARFAETLGLQLVNGRDIEAADTRDSPSVVVVNESFVKAYFNGQNPIGRTFNFVDSMDRPHTIVGVVKDARDRGIKISPDPMAYSSFEHDALGGMTFAVRVNREPEDVMREITAAVRQVDATVPLGKMRSMEAQMDESLLRERMLASLSSAFSGLAGLVTAIGIYGMLAYAVARRTREIALRMAVGARPGQVRWLMVRECLMPIVVGTAAGIPVSIAMSSAIRSQLFGITPGDPKTILVAAVAVFLLALPAVWFPARRASKVDPSAALRVE